MIEDILKKYIRHGTITSVNSDNTARVQFSDLDNLVSYNLPILVHNAGKNKQQSPPDIGCCAVCLMLPTGDSDGFVLGCYYDTKNTPPVTDLSKKMHWSFDDGTIIEYDTKAHKLLVDVKGSIEGKATTSAVIECPDITLKGNVKIMGTLQVMLGDVIVASVGAGDLTINGKITSTKSISITGGDLNVTGNIKATGTVKGTNI
ncbi:phage baseplate assembly protein V [Orbus mooreae]|uniref:phage baseplate assembly protein V n=1 Tax=Orbus mooreae TaxID=3074107 RepID=UPI00370D85FC